MSNQFQLYDLALRVQAINGNCTCNMHVGDAVIIQGGKLSLPEQPDFCLYALSSALPLLPAKQRHNHPADWMETDARVACPDPACGLIMDIERIATRILNHDDVSAIPLDPPNETTTKRPNHQSQATNL